MISTGQFSLTLCISISLLDMRKSWQIANEKEIAELNFHTKSTLTNTKQIFLINENNTAEAAAPQAQQPPPPPTTTTTTTTTNWHKTTKM
jgi:hypothetical protein